MLVTDVYVNESGEWVIEIKSGSIHRADTNNSIQFEITVKLFH